MKRYQLKRNLRHWTSSATKLLVVFIEICGGSGTMYHFRLMKRFNQNYSMVAFRGDEPSELV